MEITRNNSTLINKKQNKSNTTQKPIEKWKTTAHRMNIPTLQIHTDFHLNSEDQHTC